MKKNSFRKALQDAKGKEYIEDETPKVNKSSEEKKYTLDELKSSLLDKEGLASVVSQFPLTNGEIEEGQLYFASIPEGYPAPEIETGQYIGIGISKVIDDSDFSFLQGQIPYNRYKKSLVIRPLVRIDNGDLGYEQHQLLEDIKDTTKVKDVNGDEIKVVSNEKINYLKLVDKYFFDTLIDSTLKKYKELSDPDTTIAEYIKLKDLVGDSQMIYCPLLNKCVRVVDI